MIYMDACPRCNTTTHHIAPIVSDDDWMCDNCKFYILGGLDQEYQFQLGQYRLVVEVWDNKTIIYLGEFEKYLSTLDDVVLSPKFDDLEWIEKVILLQ
jgi:hypothetical protein